MALILKATYSTSNKNDDCDNLVVDDSTAVWNVTTNPGGYQPETGEETLASGSVDLTGGGAGSVDGITVNSVAIMSGAESFDADLTTTATAVAANITANTSSPNYTATSSGTKITIAAVADSGETPNGYAVVSSTTTITTTDVNMSGGIENSGNPKRSKLALYSFVTKKGETSDTDVPFTNIDSTADVLATWTMDIKSYGDGWYLANMLGIPIWDISTAYSVNQLIWYSGSLYRCAITTSAGETPVSAPTKWTAFASTIVNLRDVVDNTPSYVFEDTIYETSNDIIETCGGDNCRDAAYADASDGCANCGDTPEQLYMITVYLEGAKVAAARGRYLQADRKLRTLADLCAGKDCIDC